jgi:phosphoadenosine phosphosulfate reductase
MSAGQHLTGRAREALRVQKTRDAEATLGWCCRTFGNDAILTSSFGAESAVMLHMVTRVMPNIRVLLIDTGYLFPETYEFVDTLTQRFNLNLHVYRPVVTPAELEATHGRLWEGSDEQLDQYLQIAKVEPMDRALRELKPHAWLAGLRSNQTDFRAGLNKVEMRNSICKVSPILDFSEADVAGYMDEHDLPYHPLCELGYLSIGDVHSTQVAPAGSARGGRRLGSARECGIHLI